MGKYRNGRRVAVQGGRALFERMENLVRGGYPKPNWFKAMEQCPPPTLPFRCFGRVFTTVVGGLLL